MDNCSGCGMCVCVFMPNLLSDRDMAEDLVQNLFCMLWEKREEIDIRESMKAYLYRSVYHAALNSLKHEKVKLAFWEFIQKQGSKDENNIEYFIDKENQEIVFKEINRQSMVCLSNVVKYFFSAGFPVKKARKSRLN